MKITVKRVIEASVVLNESEMRALSAIAGYNTGDVANAIYSSLGKGYVLPHEGGLRSLLARVRDEITPALARIDNDDLKNRLQEKKQHDPEPDSAAVDPRP